MAFGSKTPPAHDLECVGCGKGVRPHSKSVAHEVKGWLAPRSGGGANHIRHATKTGRYAHIACLDELHDPVHANQEELF